MKSMTNIVTCTEQSIRCSVGSSNEIGLRDPLIQQFPEGPRAD